MSERRPIASRDTKLANRIARNLAERGTSPNLISQFSMVFAGLAGLCFALSALTSGPLYGFLLIVAALGCQFRLLCNLFDGMVAVEGGKGEKDGPFWNEAPDRVADLLILVGMGFGAGSLALGWAAAALAIATAYVRELGSAQGLPADFRGPMAKPQRMALTTAAAMVAAFFPLVLGLPVLEVALWAIAIGAGLTATRRSITMIAALKAR